MTNEKKILKSLILVWSGMNRGLLSEDEGLNQVQGMSNILASLDIHSSAIDGIIEAFTEIAFGTLNQQESARQKLDAMKKDIFTPED